MRTVFDDRVKAGVMALILAMTSSLLATTGQNDARGQDGGRDAAVRRHVRALETSTSGALDDVLARFERERLSSAFVSRTTPDERRDLLAAIRAAAADAGNVLVDVRDGQYVVTLEGRQTSRITFTVEDGPPFAIDALDVSHQTAPASQLVLTRDTLGATFDRLEAEGWSGVVHVRLDGDVVLERPFGPASDALDLPVTLETIFGTGSNPIDATSVSIYLLVQQGRIRLDDTIDRYFDDVPADKHAMTIRHLMTGQSGLPDFFHTADDWDPDLTWIDRTTAERRILAQPLRFAPGEDHAHSHAAFVLLAALIERVSGQSYGAFIREHLLDPAGMTRTGFYGESLGLSLADFAAGGGPDFVGIPNIPPNWGPTSWLVMGSGGMFSTLPDLQRFYRFVRSGGVLEDQYAARYRGASASLDGSDLGFELFHAYNPRGGEVFLMLNTVRDRREFRDLTAALGRLVDPGAGDAGG
jgi:CubicO group peptidase (beta-lactamase class C family)